MEDYRNELLTFRNLVFAQLLFLFSIILGKEMIKETGHSIHEPLFIFLFTAMILIYNISIYLMASHCTDNKVLKNILKGIIIIGIPAYAIVENPFIEFSEIRTPAIFLLHLLLFLIELMVIIVAISDLLKPNKTLKTKLWASVAIYLTFVITWGGIYEMFSAIMPGCMGTQFKLGLENYVECVGYSFGLATKSDNIMQPIQFINQLTKIQALMFSFFFIFLLSQFKDKVKKVEEESH